MIRFKVSTEDVVNFKVEQYQPIEVERETYEGPYDVTPKVTAQVLETAKKLMLKDVSIHAIPYFNVSNPAGGNTIYIANEV